MQDKKLLFRGGVKLSIDGRNIERFFNIAAQRELSVTQVATGEEGKVTFWTTPTDLKKMKSVAKKAGVRLRIRSRYGLPFFLYRNKKRKLLVCGVSFFFFLLYGLSFFIWDISFEGNHRFTDEMLLHYMETIPVVHGMKKASISCEELEAGIRNAFTEITWVSAEITGTRLIVHVKENEAMLTPDVPDESPCDLAAKKRGLIVRTVVRSGFCQVQEGDTVAEGTLLVDGTVPIYDDSMTLVNSHEVHSDAEIFAQTVHTFQKTVPFTEHAASRTGEIRQGIFLKFFDRIFYLMLPSKADTKWEYIMEQTQIKVLEDFYLPIYIGKIRAYEYLTYEKNYTESEIASIFDSLMMEYMENLEEKGIQILGSDGKIEQGESGWQIQGTLTVIEDIAKEVPVAEEMED